MKRSLVGVVAVTLLLVLAQGCLSPLAAEEKAEATLVPEFGKMVLAQTAAKGMESTETEVQGQAEINATLKEVLKANAVAIVINSEGAAEWHVSVPEIAEGLQVDVKNSYNCDSFNSQFRIKGPEELVDVETGSLTLRLQEVLAVVSKHYHKHRAKLAADEEFVIVRNTLSLEQDETKIEVVLGREKQVALDKPRPNSTVRLVAR